jgi:hypothetical protein
MILGSPNLVPPCSSPQKLPHAFAPSSRHAPRAVRKHGGAILPGVVDCNAFFACISSAIPCATGTCDLLPPAVRPMVVLRLTEPHYATSVGCMSAAKCTAGRCSGFRSRSSTNKFSKNKARRKEPGCRAGAAAHRRRRRTEHCSVPTNRLPKWQTSDGRPLKSKLCAKCSLYMPVLF